MRFPRPPALVLIVALSLVASYSADGRTRARNRSQQSAIRVPLESNSDAVRSRRLKDGPRDQSVSRTLDAEDQTAEAPPLPSPSATPIPSPTVEPSPITSPTPSIAPIPTPTATIAPTTTPIPSLPPLPMPPQQRLAFFPVPPPNPLPSVNPPALRSGITLFVHPPNPAQFQRAVPRVEVWRSGSLVPELVIQRGRIHPVRVSGAESLTLVLSWPPISAGKTVEVDGMRSVIVQPLQRSFVIGPTGQVSLVLQLATGAYKGEVSFTTDFVTSIIYLERVPASMIAASRGSTGVSGK